MALDASQGACSSSWTECAPAARSRDRPMACLSVAGFMAGCLSGSLGCLVGHPLDTLKVRAQNGKTLIVPPASLFRGILLPLCTAGITNAIFFGVYENAKLYMDTLMLPPFCSEGIAGAVAGLALPLLSAPVSRVTVDQQINGESFVRTLRRVHMTRSLYLGIGMTLLFELSNGPYMFIYAALKQRLANGGSVDELAMWARTAAGVGTNMIWWCAFFPIDAVRSKQQALGRELLAAGPKNSKAAMAIPGPASIVRQLFKEGGVGRFYKGLGIALLRGGPVAAVTLPVFDVLNAKFVAALA